MAIVALPSPSFSERFKAHENKESIANRPRRVIPWGFWKSIEIEIWQQGALRNGKPDGRCDTTEIVRNLEPELYLLVCHGKWVGVGSIMDTL